MGRKKFRDTVFERESQRCIVPWCTDEPDEAHHIIERKEWDRDDGYFPENGVAVCNYHHRAAENNLIQPQAFWRWLGQEEVYVPETVMEKLDGTQQTQMDIDKWAEVFDDTPSPKRDRIKYPSTGHLPFSPEWDGTRVDLTTVEHLVDVPLVVTIKMDGSNAMLAHDRVTARNGSYAEHQSFDMLKAQHREIMHLIPEHIQVFGEWIYAKHAIHYGCDGCCDDQGPALEAYFQVFGVYDQRYHIWLSWDETEQWAEKLWFPTVPVVSEEEHEQEYLLYEELESLAKNVVDEGHEGIVVRPRYPLHFGQYTKFVAKYVRKGHVQPGAKHWSKQEITQNRLKD